MNRRKFIKKTVLSSFLVGIGSVITSCSSDETIQYDDKEKSVAFKKIIKKNKIFIIRNSNEQKRNEKIYFKNTETVQSLLIIGHIMNTKYITLNMMNNPNLSIKKYTETLSLIEYNRPAEVKISNATKHELECIWEESVLNKRGNIIKYTL
ncbi:hypothetical protein E6C50_01565 [Flavobacterium supellecticarium]|uniref:Uncharacterized protein n=1 Tax=Flavobacterium supellecticarium TaxID=2565924 RepID=A0A4S4A3C8_9FLAO|nr:hypothetical protein [Flavobacterium supellecticarium]THF52921.1 hypothetical protein E6C50_01565 [Flavobacterium supellecticarium]